MNQSLSLLLNPFRRDGSFAISSINRFCWRWDQEWMLCDDYHIFDWSKSFQIQGPFCYLIAVRLTKHHPETQGEKPEKGPKPRNSFRQGAGDLGLFFISGKGGQNLKMVMEMGNDADGCLTTNVWIGRVPVVDYRWFKRFRSFYVVLVGLACPRIVIVLVLDLVLVVLCL